MEQSNLKDRLLEQLSHKADKLRHTKSWLRTPAVTKLLETTQYLVKKHGASMSTSPDHYGTFVSLTLRDLSGLKDEGLAALLDSFVHSNPDSMSTDDDAAAFARTYTFVWHGSDYDGYRPTLYVSVTANFKQESATCHRVVTGWTEAKNVPPQPIYALECSDGADTSAEDEDTEEVSA